MIVGKRFALARNPAKKITLGVKLELEREGKEGEAQAKKQNEIYADAILKHNGSLTPGFEI